MHHIQMEHQLARMFTRRIPTAVDKGIIREIIIQLVPAQAIKLIIRIAKPRRLILPKRPVKPV